MANELDLAIKKHNQGYYADAIKHYQKALKANPFSPLVKYNYGLAALLNNQTNIAKDLFESVIKSNPNYADVYCSLAAIYSKQHDYGAAIRLLEQAVALKPNFPMAFSNLGEAYRRTNQFEASVKSCLNAIALDKHYANAYFNLALAYFKLGSYQDAWDYYEWRWQTQFYLPYQRNFNMPLAFNNDIANKKILLWGEQGIGDEIMFLGDIDGLSHLNCEIILECDSRLVTLFSQSYPTIKVCPRDEKSINIKADYHLPLASIRNFLKNYTIRRNHQGYLLADQERTISLRKKYCNKNNFIIGLSWRSLNQAETELRSIPLDGFEAIFSNKNISFLSLQPKMNKQELFTNLIVDNELDSFNDLSDYAAQVNACDLVITIDNSTAHFAGALGKPVWLMLPWSADWRWQHQSRDTYWYKTMRCFQQSIASDWNSVLMQVGQELEQWLKQK